MAGNPAWWNLDLYFSEIIAANLRDYVANSQAIPVGYSESQWTSKLNSIAERLEVYKTLKFSNKDEEVTENAKKAMHELAEIFPYLWG